MPYVSPDARMRLWQQMNGQPPIPETAGELTYILYITATHYLATKGNKYQTHAEVLGALDATSKEYYRRKVAPYEDKKIEENGDVS